MSTEITVSNLSQLQSALAQAKGGETIKLQDGYYGSIDISKDFASKVTIEAINLHKVTFDDIDVPGGSNIHLDGLVINDQSRIDQNAEHVTISNSILKNGLYFRDSDNVVVDNNDISGGHNTLTLNDVTNFTITENYIHHAGSDVVRITGTSKYGLFENNTVYDVAAVRPDHPDLVQMFGTSEGTPSNITFRGNHLHDDPTTGSVYGQGFFFSDPSNGGYKNILIEDNLINVGSPNSIYIWGGQENVVIQNNTLIPWPDGGGAIIVIAEKSGGWNNEGTTIVGNIAKLILNETSIPNVSGNYFYGRDADLNKLFSGDGSQWQDFVPVDGSPIDLSTGLGAFGRLIDLINGTSSGSSTSIWTESVSTPDPTPTEPVSTPEPTPTEPEPTPEGSTDQGQIDPSLDGIAYAMIGAHEFTNSSDVIEVAHSSDLALDAATISFSFNADTVSGTHGLTSKDASYYTGGGNHLAGYIQDGNLIVRFQDGAGDEIARIGGIEADTDYDLQISFGDGNVSIWLNEEQVHSADFSTSWATNVEYLQFGARGWSSKSGEAGFSNVFDGTISDIIVAEGNLTPTQLQNLLSNAPDNSGTSGTSGSNIVYELTATQTFNGKTDSIVNLGHDAAYEVQEGTIAFTFNADDLNGTQGLFSKDASYYTGGGNHISAMLKNDQLYLRFQDEDSDAVFSAPGIEAGADYDVQAWFGDGEVGLAVNGVLIGTKAFEVDLGLNHQNMQFGGLGWGSSDGGDQISNAFDGTISEILILDQAVPIDNFDLFA